MIWPSEAARINAIEEQKAWEVEGVNRGVARYRKEVAKANQKGNEADLPPGERMMVELIGNMAPAINEKVQDALDRIVAGNGASRFPWLLPMLSLTGEQWAYITGRTALSFADRERSATHVALAIAGRGRDQVDLENWKDHESSLKAEAKGRGATHRSVYDEMIRRVKTISPRSARKWMKKCATFERSDWSLETRTHVGNLLLHVLVENGGGWFQFDLVYSTERGRFTSERRLKLTDIAREYLQYHHAQSELTRPWMLPMLCPPNDWRMS